MRYVLLGMIMTMLQSGLCRAQASYVPTTLYDSLGVSPARIQIKYTRELSKGFNLQKKLLTFERRFDPKSKWHFGVEIQQQQAPRHQWIDSGLLLGYAADHSLVSLQLSKRFQPKHKDFYPAASGLLSYSIFLPKLKFGLLRLFVYDPVAWSNGFVSQGLFRNALEGYVELEPLRQRSEIVASVAVARLFKEKSTSLGLKRTASVRVGYGPEIVNLKLGLFTDQERWLPTNVQYASSFSRSISIYGPYFSTLFNLYATRLSIYALSRYGWGSSDSLLKKANTNEISLDGKVGDSAVIRAGYSSFHGVGETQEASDNYTVFMAARVIL